MHDGAAKVLHVLGGILIAAIAAVVIVVLAIATFGLNPAWPVVVSLGAIAGGAVAASRSHDYLMRGLGYGLVTGGLVAVLLWPLFAVD